MVSTITISLLSVVSLFLVWKVLHPNLAKVRNLEDWEARKHEVDPEVFRLLLDPAEELYLRRSFPPREFRVFQRRRMALALRSLRLVEENTAMLMKLGQLARSDTNPILAKEAEDLIQTALRLRVNLLLSQPCLYLKWLVPGWTWSFPAVEMPYRELLSGLNRIQQERQRELNRVLVAS